MTTHILSLEGKIAAVIGGTSGIGRALSLGLADSGSAVIASARRKETGRSPAKSTGAAAG
jgi:NAD(P)-dependent dehydrogenase (short-subunit alcohol dehydrogenase family)